MFEQNALSQLLQLLFSKNITEAALDALASLTHSNSEISLALLDGPVVERICALLKDRNTRLRVLACSCLANMSRASSLPTARQHELAALALPVAVRLVGEGEGGFHEAPRVVAQLVSGNADMQKVACDAEVVPRLAKLLKVDSNMTQALLNLLTDGSTEVKEAAAATLCNMVLDFSPMKEQLLSSGGLRHLAVLAQAPQYVLRLNSMWALKNLLYLSKSPSKEAVMQSLSYTTMRQLLLNDVEEVQGLHSEFFMKEYDLSPRLLETTLLALAALTERHEQSRKQLVQAKVLDKIVQALANNEQGSAKWLDTKFEEEGEVGSMQEQALTVVRNLVYGSPEDIQRVLQYSGGDVLLDALMRTSIPQAMLACLKDPQSCIELKVAALWCLINLSWQDKGEGGYVDAETAARVSKLRKQGFEELLHCMKDDASLDIKERVRTALEQFAKSPEMSDMPTHPTSPMQQDHDQQSAPLAWEPGQPLA
eukprot:gene3657-4592_t